VRAPRLKARSQLFNHNRVESTFSLRETRYRSFARGRKDEALTRPVLASRNLIENVKGRTRQRDLMGLTILGSEAWQYPQAFGSVKLVPSHSRNLLTALTSQKQQSHEWPERVANLTCGLPKKGELVVAQHAIPSRHWRRGRQPFQRGSLEVSTANGPAEQLAKGCVC
jgi:hypothetical protein